MQIGSTEALKAQMEKCIVSDCKDCPYTDAQICDTAMTKDALEYIESLEERIAIMQESMAELEKRCNALDALEQRCKTLEVLEAAEPWPTPHAQWLVYKSGNANCSACGYEIFSGRERTPYCPRCGCVMEEVSE